MDDLDNYIEKRRKTSPEFTVDFDSQSDEFKI
jgi:hypothetical protein